MGVLHEGAVGVDEGCPAAKAVIPETDLAPEGVQMIMV
jgi:hypothetical protein